jgi:hypothetical protein
MRFKYSTTDSSQNEFDSLPRIPLILRNNNQAIEVVGLVDSGATVNVLPYDIGVKAGWCDRSYCKPISKLYSPWSSSALKPSRNASPAL